MDIRRLTSLIGVLSALAGLPARADWNRSIELRPQGVCRITLRELEEGPLPTLRPGQAAQLSFPGVKAPIGVTFLGRQIARKGDYDVFASFGDTDRIYYLKAKGLRYKTPSGDPTRPVPGLRFTEIVEQDGETCAHHGCINTAMHAGEPLARLWDDGLSEVFDSEREGLLREVARHFDGQPVNWARAAEALYRERGIPSRWVKSDDAGIEAALTHLRKGKPVFLAYEGEYDVFHKRTARYIDGVEKEDSHIEWEPVLPTTKIGTLGHAVAIVGAVEVPHQQTRLLVLDSALGELVLWRISDLRKHHPTQPMNMLLAGAEPSGHHPIPIVIQKLGAHPRLKPEGETVASHPEWVKEVPRSEWTEASLLEKHWGEWFLLQLHPVRANGDEPEVQLVKIFQVGDGRISVYGPDQPRGKEFANYHESELEGLFRYERATEPSTPLPELLTRLPSPSARAHRTDLRPTTLGDYVGSARPNDLVVIEYQEGLKPGLQTAVGRAHSFSAKQKWLRLIDEATGEPVIVDPGDWVKSLYVASHPLERRVFPDEKASGKPRRFPAEELLGRWATVQPGDGTPAKVGWIDAADPGALHLDGARLEPHQVASIVTYASPEVPRSTISEVLKSLGAGGSANETKLARIKAWAASATPLGPPGSASWARLGVGDRVVIDFQERPEGAYRVIAGPVSSVAENGIVSVLDELTGESQPLYASDLVHSAYVVRANSR